MAVAGFAPDELDLVVKGQHPDHHRPQQRRAADGGAALSRHSRPRAFERRFVLADHIVVDGADLKNGLLHVGLKRVVPEALKPRRITIGQASATPSIAPSVANDGQVADAKAA